MVSVLIRIVLVLVALALAVLVAYAYLGDLSPAQAPVTKPVILDAN